MVHLNQYSIVEKNIFFFSVYDISLKSQGKYHFIYNSHNFPIMTLLTECAYKFG